MNLPKPTTSDRRAHDRHPMRTSAVLALPGGRAVPARTLDIGNGGAGVVSDLNLVVGTAVVIRLNLPTWPTGSTAFEATATVKSCSLAGNEGGFRLGLEFNSLSAAAKAALHGLKQ